MTDACCKVKTNAAFQILNNCRNYLPQKKKRFDSQTHVVNDLVHEPYLETVLAVKIFCERYKYNRMPIGYNQTGKPTKRSEHEAEESYQQQ